MTKFGVYHTELLLLWVSKSRWQVTTRIKVFIFWFWTLFCHFHTVKFFAIVPESSYSKKVLFSQFWVRFCCIRILFSSNTINIWFNLKKVLNLLQKRVLPRYGWFFVVYIQSWSLQTFQFVFKGKQKCAHLLILIFSVLFLSHCYKSYRIDQFRG